MNMEKKPWNIISPIIVLVYENIVIKMSFFLCFSSEHPKMFNTRGKLSVCNTITCKMYDYALNGNAILGISLFVTNSRSDH